MWKEGGGVEDKVAKKVNWILKNKKRDYNSLKVLN